MSDSRRAVDSASMRAAITCFVEALKPGVTLGGCAGARARLLTAVFPAFVEALTAELDRGTDPDAAYDAVVKLMVHIATSAVASSISKTFLIEEETDLDRLGTLLEFVFEESYSRLSSNETFRTIPVVNAGHG